MPIHNHPCVSVVFTGGTISMRFDPAAGGAVPAMSGAEILARVPGLDSIARVSALDFARLPGPHMTPALMLELARVVRQRLDEVTCCGVVVTHGTDTLEETAYLLDLVLASDKPVVFAGAMRHSSEDGWDGPANLLSAVRVAASSEARGLGVLVCLNELILVANDATKTHTVALDTFQGRDSGPLGRVGSDGIVMQRRRVRREHIAPERIEERVEIVKLAAGSDGRLIRRALEEGCRGLVIEGLGCGNVPLPALGEVLRAVDGGIPVVITSRCHRGPIAETYAYEGAARKLREAGAILGGSVPSHKARIKLMLLLGAGGGLERIRVSFNPAG
ncbi:MAG: asparaginase [Verrucomicrobia bacterium]|nr:asparaginase [Verrucomicrobiota bacterium]